MPRVSRTRTSLPGHSKSAKQISTPDALDDSYMMDPAEMAPIQAPRSIEPSSSTASATVTAAEVPLDEVAKKHSSDSKPRLTKSEKAQLKRQNLLDQINQRATPYSKSHSRRLKRAARPESNLVTSLSDVQDVLPSLEPDFEEPGQSEEEGEGDEMQDDQEPQGKKAGNGGKGKEKLTAKKRQRVLTNESTRLPAILANSSFSKSPFATIRMHTLNTMAAQKAQQEAAAMTKGKKAAARK
ncbi:Slx9p [Sporobolomyces salmoneus]|uniref:Slx9p n=1 Tax=Sporobolomyces salmoneus TaxID=183962 RepID=UPI00316F92AF